MKFKYDVYEKCVLWAAQQGRS